MFFKSLTFSLIFASSLVQAEVYNCTQTGRTFDDQKSFLFVVNRSVEKAAIFESADGSSWQEIYTFKDTAALTAADGGPLTIVGKDSTPVNWKKEKNCFKWKNATYQISLQHITDASNGSQYDGVVQLSANIEVNPAKKGTCDMPLPALPAPIWITCEAL